ncbi:hypothetical protein [Mangrovivirga cuniculi]|nr:hypothetical protein [Mangrovivirga cuniculi]
MAIKKSWKIKFSHDYMAMNQAEITLRLTAMVETRTRASDLQGPRYGLKM